MNADVKPSRALEHPKLDVDTCLGAPLAQFETHAAVRRFLEMAPSYRIAAPVQYTGFGGQGPIAVPVTLH